MMNATDALLEAINVWRAPDDMVQMWRESEWKAHHEDLVARWVGNVKTVADVGCGSGRYAFVIEWRKGYWGYDVSPRMIELAKQTESAGLTFSVVDILAYQGNEKFDAVLFIDVAQHYPDPLGAIKIILSNWQAKRYFVSLVCGAREEALFATTVIPYEWLLELWGKEPGINLERMYMERFDGAEHLSWVLLELTRQSP